MNFLQAFYNTKTGNTYYFLYDQGYRLLEDEFIMLVKKEGLDVREKMKEDRRKISILGIGWLGFPLAKKLIENGFNIKGSTTSESKLDLLKNNNIQPFQIELSEKEIKGNIEGFLDEF